MKLQKRSRIWLSMALCLGLSGTAFIVHAQDDSTSGVEASQSGNGGAKGMQHHSPHGKDYKGHHGKGHHGMGGQGAMHQGAMVELDLDESQREEISEIQKKLRSDLAELTAQRSEQAQRLEALYAADQLYPSDITNQQQRVFDIIKQITKLQVEAQLDMRKLLSTTQINKLKESGDWLMVN